MREAVEDIVDGMNERDKILVVLNSHREHLADEITAALGK